MDDMFWGDMLYLFAMFWLFMGLLTWVVQVPDKYKIKKMYVVIFWPGVFFPDPK
jgi:hypothetical protein